MDTEIDWMIKKKLIDAYAARNGLDLTHPRIAQLDLTYHDVRAGRGLHSLLVAKGRAARVVTDEQIIEATTVPPQTTRARLRGEFVAAAQDAGRDYTVDWVHLKLNDQAQRTVLLKDPFRAHRRPGDQADRGHVAADRGAVPSRPLTAVTVRRTGYDRLDRRGDGEGGATAEPGDRPGQLAAVPDRAWIRDKVAGYSDAPNDEAFFRTFERDKQELRELGIPLQTPPTGEDGYRIPPVDFALPAMSFTPAEAAALALAGRLWETTALDRGRVRGAAQDPGRRAASRRRSP